MFRKSTLLATALGLAILGSLLDPAAAQVLGGSHITPAPSSAGVPKSAPLPPGALGKLQPKAPPASGLPKPPPLPLPKKVQTPPIAWPKVPGPLGIPVKPNPNPTTTPQPQPPMMGDKGHPGWHHPGWGRGFGGGFPSIIEVPVEASAPPAAAVRNVPGQTIPVGTMPAQAAPEVGGAASCNCLTKQYLADGSVLFRDICTKEAAVVTADETKARASNAQ